MYYEVKHDGELVSNPSINLLTLYGLADPGRKKVKNRYINAVAAFDIETTRIKEIEQSVLYIWQCQIEDHTYIGRSWDDYKDFVRILEDSIPDFTYLILFVHNLSYEFQFLRGIFNFLPDDVFVMGPRKILYAKTGKIEYRCSYIQTNLSLNDFTHKMGVPDPKLSGYDYNKLRFSWTQLTREELLYCLNDVRGLVQAMKIQINLEHDNLYTLPLTNTGYVRRDVKQAMKTVNKQLLKDMQPDEEVYLMLREAFRGGNTHANRFYSGEILQNVHSWDSSSDYPFQQCLRSFPMGKWTSINTDDLDLTFVFDKLIKKHRCCLLRIVFFDIELNNPMWGCPYLSSDKCRSVRNAAYDNGRILKAEVLETTITDIDLEIIVSEYTFKSCVILKLYHCRSGLLPEQWRKCNLNYFIAKTLLKGDPEQELFYMKSKNKLNSIYGMSVTDPCKQMIKYNPNYNAADPDDNLYLPGHENIHDLLARDQKYIYRNYAWGVWTTAHARKLLEDAINLVPVENFVYCDTDSVKFIGDADFDSFNNRLRKESLKAGVYADDSKGKRHYMGVFEQDAAYQYFCTLGAKKYAYVDYNGLHTTIAGVSKKKGGDELKSIWNFKEGFTFVTAGGTRSIYNDDPAVKEYTIDGHTIEITSNVVIAESEYTLGITAEYERLLSTPNWWLDSFGGF